jgi:hypothetical protein
MLVEDKKELSQLFSVDAHDEHAKVSTIKSDTEMVVVRESREDRFLWTGRSYLVRARISHGCLS